MLEDNITDNVEETPILDVQVFLDTPLNLDAMILGIKVEPIENDRIRLKFVAISGGTGPSLDFDRRMAEDIIKGLNIALAGHVYNRF